MKSGKVRLALLSALMLLVSILLVACGGGSSSSTPTSSESSTEESGGGGGVEQTPEKIGVLQLLGSVNVTVRGTEAIEEAAKVLDWETSTVDSQGDPAKANTALTQLISQGSTGIINAGPWEPVAIRQPLTQAKEKEIPVVSFWGQVESAGLTADYAPSDTEIGEKSVEALEEAVPGGGEVAAFTSPAFGFGKPRDKVFEETIGTDPKWNVVATHATDYTNIQPDTTKAMTDILNAHPNLSAVWTDASVQDPPIATVLRQKGLCGKVAVIALYAEAENLKALREGCLTEIIDPPIQAQTWADMDLLAGKLISGKELPESNPTSYPYNPWELITITKETLPSNPEEFPDLKFDYKKYFTEKWEKGDYGAP